MIIPLDDKLRRLLLTFEEKVRVAADYHGVEAGALEEAETKFKRSYTVQISSHGRRIGQVSHVQYRTRKEWGAYTVTQTGGAGSFGQSGIQLGWLKEHTRRKPPTLRVVTADYVLGRRK